MVKAAAGGGGRGMRLVDDEAELAAALAQRAAGGAERPSATPELLLERAVPRRATSRSRSSPTRTATCVHLGERDCSVQRRHQKLIEETPSPAVAERCARRMGAARSRWRAAVGYRGAGTVEFLLDRDGDVLRSSR